MQLINTSPILNFFTSDMNDDQRNESIVRQVLKNEITWLVMLVATIMAFVYNVIIPVNQIQLQLLQVQKDIAEIRGQQTFVSENARNITVLQEQVKNITERLNIK